MVVRQGQVWWLDRVRCGGLLVDKHSFDGLEIPESGILFSCKVEFSKIA